MRILSKSDLGFITRDNRTEEFGTDVPTFQRATPTSEFMRHPKDVSTPYIHPRKYFRPNFGVKPLRRWSIGLSEGAAVAAAAPQTGGFWGAIGSTLGGIVSNVLPAFAQIEIAKRQVRAADSLYTPQNIDVLRRQAEYEAQTRANYAAAEANTTSAPITMNTLLMIGGGIAGLLLFMNMRKK